MMLVDLVSKPLAIFLNKTMDEGCIPQDWKMAYVSPIFKKGPISLTSTVCKSMESFVKDPIMTPHETRKSFVMETVWFHKWKIHQDKIVVLS